MGSESYIQMKMAHVQHNDSSGKPIGFIGKLSWAGLAKIVANW
ncbi:hypothetical protein [Kingella kingae]|nr:hypothetical protein [Kingella kingae]